METPTYLLFLLGCLGGVDIALFHSVSHSIRSHPDSVGELVTHSLRGPTYAALFVLIPNFVMQGFFAWGLVALFAFDMGISIWDFSLEQGSRRFLGGLPSGEYVLHMLMAIVFGSLVTSVFYSVGEWFHAPTRIVYAPTSVPGIVRFSMLIMAVLVLISGLQDALAVVRLRRSPLRSDSQPRARGALSIRQPDPVPENMTATATPFNSGAGATQRLGWMRAILIAAGVYNLTWGGWVVLFPAALFRWTGMAPTNYPQIWQSVGMIVGVYGIGYLIAARAPFRHWPIVFVGLLGKVLGPAGMFCSVAQGNLAAGMAWTCVTNDLIWWAFAFILYRAFALQREGGLVENRCGSARHSNV